MADDKGFRDATSERISQASGFTRDKSDQTRQGVMHAAGQDKGGGGTQQTADSMREKAAAAKDQTQQTAQSGAQRVQEKAAAAKEQTQQTAQSAAQKSQEKTAAAKDQAAHLMSKVGDSARGALEKTKEMVGMGAGDMSSGKDEGGLGKM